ncbi:TSUP family transporter [Clostridium sp. JN-9]|uniref:TSUP family transporter n=1 Tax=Clostridium sp. JN-9 TaxID=2507159 RepID=UPI000FFE0A3C|nr:TSUP family transporter [Clostridium sp. JN-9]QAT40684.1 hypothetical protein EQM05_10640 [Clostridium sp. JN-9]
MTYTVFNFIFVCAAGFFAAIVDSIAGGGGLISLPAFLLVGVSPHYALGTNKFAASCASFTSSVKFIKSGKTDSKLLKYLIPFTLLGAAVGVQIVLKIDQKYLYTMVLIMILAVGIYSLFSKTIGLEDKFTGLSMGKIILGILLAFSLGFYDGFFGPGTGSFLIFGLIKIFGFDFVRAGGNGKILNFVSNITSLILFAFHGQISYLIGIPVAICMILGAKIGTEMVLSKGAKLMKPIFVTMSLAVAVKMLYNLLC